MKKIDRPNSGETYGKTLSRSQLIRFTTNATIIVCLFSTTQSYNQTLPYPLNIQKKERSELVGKNTISPIKEHIDHETIIKKNINDIIAEYGKEKGMEIIRQHFLQQINKKRTELKNPPLKSHTIMNELAQSKSQDMADHEYFDHIDSEGVSDAGRMMKDGRYNFEIYSTNISYNIKTIEEVIQSYINNNKRKTGHYDILSVKEYEDLGVGLAKGKDGIWYIMINYGKQSHKK